MIFIVSHTKYQNEIRKVAATFWLEFHANVDCGKNNFISRNVCSDHVMVEF